MSRLDAAGAALVYSTYLGGSLDDRALWVAVGPGGEVAVSGQTGSINFPVQAPFQLPSGGGTDAFIAPVSIAARSLR